MAASSSSSSSASQKTGSSGYCGFGCLKSSWGRVFTVVILLTAVQVFLLQRQERDILQALMASTEMNKNETQWFIIMSSSSTSSYNSSVITAATGGENASDANKTVVTVVEEQQPVEKKEDEVKEQQPVEEEKEEGEVTQQQSYEDYYQEGNHTLQQVTVFYNIYIGPRPNHVTDTKRIVSEQMEQLGNTTRRYNQHAFKVYYVTVGQDHAITPAFMQDVCARHGLVACIHLEHFAKGYEEVTLTQLYNYCQTNATRPDERVVYMHSKGSYHVTQANERWRWHLTDGVVHPICLNPPNQTCHACGVLWHAVWMPMFPGNFWSARCDYVNTLLPPVEFERLGTVVQQPALEPNTSFIGNMYRIEGWTIGLGRMAQEAWIGSHPTVNPCDLSTSPDVRTWLRPYNATQHRYEFHAGGPRFPLESSPWFMLRQRLFQSRVLTTKFIRMREYFLLAGKLHKWLALYHEIPPADSWVWKWFPDAEEWQAAYVQYGNETVVKMLEKYMEEEKQQQQQSRE